MFNWIISNLWSTLGTWDYSLGIPNVWISMFIHWSIKSLNNWMEKTEMLVIAYPTSSCLIKRKSFLFGFFVYSIRSCAHWWATCVSVISPKMWWIKSIIRYFCTPHLHLRYPGRTRVFISLSLCYVVLFTFPNSFAITGSRFMHFPIRFHRQFKCVQLLRFLCFFFEKYERSTILVVHGISTPLHWNDRI